MKSRMLKNLHGPSFLAFSNVLHIIMEVSGPSLLIESTDSIILANAGWFNSSRILQCKIPYSQGVNISVCQILLKNKLSKVDLHSLWWETAIRMSRGCRTCRSCASYINDPLPTAFMLLGIWSKLHLNKIIYGRYDNIVHVWKITKTKHA